jgi:hypothetical protein
VKVAIMYQLTYISTARPGADDQLKDILAIARRRNRQNGITGLLIADGKRFLQALEGEGPIIEATFARIKNDPRHFAVVMLSMKEIVRREFGDWEMACKQVELVRNGMSLIDTVDALVAQVPDKNTQALFSGFARIDRDAA